MSKTAQGVQEPLPAVHEDFRGLRVLAIARLLDVPDDGRPALLLGVDGPAPTSRLITMAGRAQRLPHPVIACLLAILFEIPLLAIFVAIESAELNPGTVVTAALATAAVLGVVYVLYLIQVGAWVIGWERRRFDTVGLRPERAGRKVLRGAGLGVAAYLLLLGLLGALGMVERKSLPGLELGLVAVAAVIALLGWGVQALGEEVVYRGWLLQVVAARTSIGMGVAVSTAIFTVTHFIVGEFDVVLLVNLVLFGVFWSLWALHEGGLWGVFGWHAVTSWVSENLVVVGEGAGYGRVQDGLLLGLNETGPDHLTGGDIGLEASILTSAMLVVGIVVLSVSSLRRASHGRLSGF